MIFWPRPDMLNHVQRDEGFAGIHAVLITIGGRDGKNCFDALAEKFSANQNRLWAGQFLPQAQPRRIAKFRIANVVKPEHS